MSAPTRKDLEAIAVELAILRDPGCAGLRVSRAYELTMFEVFKVHFESPGAYIARDVPLRDVEKVWLERQSAVGLRNRIEILESKVADLVRQRPVRR